MIYATTEKWGALPEEVILEKCIAVNGLNSTQAQCHFIKSVPDCEDNDGFINYVELVYCIIGSDELLVLVFILILWLIILFIGLGVTADDFLCPSLLVISKTLRLSQNIAGVTFLAFGNGAPDIFSSLAGIKKARTELVIGELFGAGIFVTTVVAGSILLSNEFKLMERPLLRDIMFYMFATYLTWLLVFNGQIKCQHAIGFIVIYLLYIIIVIVGRIINSRFRKKANIHIENGITDISSACHFQNHSSQHALHNHHSNAIYTVTHEENPDCCRKRVSSWDRETYNSSEETVPILSSQILVRKSRTSYSSISTLLADRSLSQKQNQWSEFLIHICPVDIKEWCERTCFGKLVQIVKSPIYFLLTITIPVVDYENSKNNWCRVLNALHCITGPLCILLLTGNFFRVVHSVPLVFIFLSLSILISLVVILTSHSADPPKYHWAFGYLGFAVSVSWIYALANEVVDLLQAIGIIFSLSDVILGLTVLAWGNSIGDVVSNISIARHGFPRMGLSACFGGPLMNLLMGIGLPYTFFLNENGGSLRLEYSDMVSLLYSTITFSLASTLVVVLFTGFESKKYHGIFLISLYIVYFVLASMIEFDII